MADNGQWKLLKGHGSVWGTVGWGGAGALCRAGGCVGVGICEGRGPLGWEEVVRAVGQQMAQEG